jgi:TDG/mug DNA glycosylase family protein
MSSMPDHGEALQEPGLWQPILRPGLDVVFVGYNPSLPAWRTGHYYANPGNRFYRLLFEAGLTPRLLSPAEDRTLPAYGIGAVDLLAVPSARADLVPAAEFRAAAPALLRRLADLAPRAICCNGVGVHRHLFGAPPERLGHQPDRSVGPADLFVVPSTSGLCNGRAAARLAAFRELAAWLGRQDEPDAAAPPAGG